MNLPIIILSAGLGGAVASGIIIAFVLFIISKKIKKVKQSKISKELKKDKEIKYIIENIKQINNQLQLETTPIAKLLDSFNISKEDIENFILVERAKRKELSEKDKKKAINIKF